MDQDGWEWGVLSFAGHEFLLYPKIPSTKTSFSGVQPLGMAQMALGTTEQ